MALAPRAEHHGRRRWLQVKKETHSTEFNKGTVAIPCKDADVLGRHIRNSLYLLMFLQARDYRKKSGQRLQIYSEDYLVFFFSSENECPRECPTTGSTAARVYNLSAICAPKHLPPQPPPAIEVIVAAMPAKLCCFTFGERHRATY